MDNSILICRNRDIVFGDHMKKKKSIHFYKRVIATVITAAFVLNGCASAESLTPEGYEEIDPNLMVTPEDVAEVLGTEDITFAQSVPYEDRDQKADTEELNEDEADPEAEADEPMETEYLPGYADEKEYKTRETGSVSYIWEPTVIVSIFIDEEEDLWTEEEKDYILNLCNTAYSFIETEMKEKYDTETSIIYDWKEDPSLAYSIRLYESVPTFVTGQEEMYLNSLADEWIESVPYRDLMLKYDTSSIGFLYLIPHEGCSYSEMHCVEDSPKTWHDGSFMYLQDLYSDTYEYETPTVYAHELLHLFGAEDFYDSAEIYSQETYDALAELASDDIMLRTFATINGQYTTFPNEVYGEISPYTAYLLGIGDDSAVSEVPELIRPEAACFPGTSLDRAFKD